jgi:pseudouridine synthase
LELTEGKNREIRRLCAVLGLRILRLRRKQIGPIRLGELPAGKWRTLTEAEIKSLLGRL